MTNIIEEQNAITDSNIALFNPQYLTAINQFAQVMSGGAATVPQHLRGNPADCMAIAMQAAQWQMNPFAVAQKTYVVNGVLGYEAQLVNAVISTRGPLVDRISYDWFGPWEKVIGKFVIRKNKDGKEYRSPGWSLADEEGIGIRVWATLKGEKEPRELVLYLAQARVRNSTLWADDPRQQLAYLAVKRWARLYCPEVILGVYTIDELEKPEEREINPLRGTSHVTASQVVGATEPAEEPADDAVPEKMAADIRSGIDKITSTAEATELRASVENLKSQLGITLYTELKNKIVKQHHRLNAIAALAASIDTAGTNGATSQERADLEALLRRSERFLDADEAQRYQQAIADLPATQAEAC
ncbi:RecT family recombinase [Serratia rhizosphaerae]